MWWDLVTFSPGGSSVVDWVDVGGVGVTESRQKYIQTPHLS